MLVLITLTAAIVGVTVGGILALLIIRFIILPIADAIFQ